MSSENVPGLSDEQAKAIDDFICFTGNVLNYLYDNKCEFVLHQFSIK